MTTAKASVYLDARRDVGDIDSRIFGGFLEHMGRAVYQGIYEPGSPLADEHGFRTDVADAIAALNMPVMRYPGGNFVSNYDWRDGVGPVAQRPARTDFAWRSLESNEFGTDEFLRWCDRANTVPMMAVNLGTGSAKAAAELVEYCNHPGGTANSDLRASNGHPAPYDIRLWCLGNEMDGPWQAGHVPAQAYAEKARTASQLMKGIDPRIETVACGSSDDSLPSYLEWDDIVLDHCWDSIDYISAHRYSRKRGDDSESFLAEGVLIDKTINDYRALLRLVRSRRNSFHAVHLSFDEWNVWYRDYQMDGGWTEAPHLIEERYNLEDALVVGQYLHSFIRHADVVKIGCLAQVANVIAPILTRSEGLLRQSIYWPFQMLSAATSGRSMVAVTDAPTIPTKRVGEVPALDVAASHDAENGSAMVSIINRQASGGLDVDVELAGLPTIRASARMLHHTDPKAQNSWEEPDLVSPSEISVDITDGGIWLHAPPLCHVVVEMEFGS